MALIRLAPVVGDIRGSIGGVTFARNYAGNYARNRTKPTYPATPLQSSRTATMSTMVAHWQGTLSTAQRVAWNNRAKDTTLRNALGQDYHPSGVNLYVRSNFLLSLTGQTLVTTPPAVTVTPALACTVVYDEGFGMRISAIGDFDTGVGGKLMFQRATSRALSRFFFAGPWDALAVTNITSLDALPYQVANEALCDSGTRQWCRFRVVPVDGEVSAWTKYYVDRA